MKYTVTISEGCTAFYTEINEKIVGGEYKPTCLTEEETDEFVDYLCEKFKEELKQGSTRLDDLIKCFQPDSWESENSSCDQCGDTVHKTVWEF